MSLDYLGNPIDTLDPSTRQGLDDFIGGFLGYQPRAEGILATADADPDSALANAFAGVLLMFIESPEGPTLAEHYRQRAAAVNSDHPRAQLYLAALQAWINDDLDQVLHLSEHLLDRYPRDLFAAKLNQYLEFNRGNWPALLRIGLKATVGAPDIAHSHGLLAFAYEQCHLLDEAEASAREALRLHNIKTGLEIVTVSDIPGNGTGLGSSSAMAVGLVNALSRDVSPTVLAERAFVVENEKCGHPTGKQDAYASAFGGMNYFTFDRRSVEVTPIHPSDEWMQDFESHSLLLWTGMTRDGNEILKSQSRNFSSGGNIEIGSHMAQLAGYLYDAILNRENMVHIGGLVNEAWRVKKFFANGISNGRIDGWYDTAMQNGAYGGKLCGAGGGGFLFLLAPPSTHAKIAEQTGLCRVNFKIEPRGSEVIYDG